ncbi:MAG: hypothetical protein AB1730_07510 [Myxococcota bacterium]|jgi:hypothetical protein
MIRHSVLVLAVALTACTHSSGGATSTSASPVPAKGKPTAPVAVTAQVSERAARVTVTFEADAKDVQVGVHGVDGLVVEGDLAPVKGQAFARGETASFTVALVPPQGRASLVVSVAGDFNGARRARVAAFSVGEGPLPEGPGEVMTTDDGDTVKVMPAGP